MTPEALRAPGSEVPYSEDPDRFVDVDQGNRWMCVRCGKCCSTTFTQTWLDVALREYIGEPVDGYCRHLDHSANRCGIHDRRPNICRGYPFILRKEGDHYKVQVHSRCSGIGHGPTIDIARIADMLVRLCEDEYDMDFHMDLSEVSLNIVRLYRIK